MNESAVVHKFFALDQGLMLDVGAHHGHTLMPFARDGWQVHAFEPDPENRIHLQRAAQGLSNVVIVPKAVADVPGDFALYRSEESSGISTLAPFADSHVSEGTVQVLTLSDYLEPVLDDVTFLKVDVEGFERHVLEGYPWEIKRPRAILLEFEDRKSKPLGYQWTDLANGLVEHGYRVLVSEWYPIVAYGGSHRWRRFAEYPVALLDESAWGNLLAVEPPEFERLKRTADQIARRYALRRRVDALRPR